MRKPNVVRFYVYDASRQVENRTGASGSVLSYAYGGPLRTCASPGSGMVRDEVALVRVAGPKRFRVGRARVAFVRRELSALAAAVRLIDGSARRLLRARDIEGADAVAEAAIRLIVAAGVVDSRLLDLEPRALPRARRPALALDVDGLLALLDGKDQELRAEAERQLLAGAPPEVARAANAVTSPGKRRAVLRRWTRAANCPVLRIRQLDAQLNAAAKWQRYHAALALGKLGVRGLWDEVAGDVDAQAIQRWRAGSG